MRTTKPEYREEIIKNIINVKKNNSYHLKKKIILSVNSRNICCFRLIIIIDHSTPITPRQIERKTTTSMKCSVDFWSDAEQLEFFSP